jgi:hypothetical protein
MARVARASNEQSDQGEEAPLLASEQVTYIPGEGDPVSTKWHGIVFHANVPKTINKPILIEQARGNRFFKVGEFDPARDKVATIEVSDPKTPGEYRAHFVAWFNKLSVNDTNGINQMVAMWAKEQPMREMCEVGTDDYSYIGTLFNPKMHQLMMAANINPGQLAELWARHGVQQLPF